MWKSKSFGVGVMAAMVFAGAKADASAGLVNFSSDDAHALVDAAAAKTKKVGQARNLHRAMAPAAGRCRCRRKMIGFL